MHIVFTFLFVTNYELRQLISNNVLDTRVKACLYSLHWRACVAECQGATILRMRQHGGVISDAHEVWNLNNSSDDTRVSVSASFSHRTSNEAFFFFFVAVAFYINGTFRRCCDWFIKRKSGICQPCCFEVPGELGSCPPLLDWPAINSWKYDH